MDSPWSKAHKGSSWRCLKAPASMTHCDMPRRSQRSADYNTEAALIHMVSYGDFSFQSDFVLWIIVRNQTGVKRFMKGALPTVKKVTIPQPVQLGRSYPHSYLISVFYVYLAHKSQIWRYHQYKCTCKQHRYHNFKSMLQIYGIWDIGQLQHPHFCCLWIQTAGSKIQSDSKT